MDDRHTIKQVTHKNILGVVLDEQLNWQEQNDVQCKKEFSKAITILRRAKNFVTQDELINVVNSLVLPHFTYCSNVWNDGNGAHLEKLYNKITKKGCYGDNAL